MATLRFKALGEISRREPIEPELSDKKISDYFGARRLRPRENAAVYFQGGLRKPMRRDRRRTSDRPQDRQPSRARHEDVGHGERRDPLLALVPAAERLDGRKARRLFRAHVGRRLVRNVQGRAARTAGARRIELPERRAAQYVRGPGLLGMGPLLAGIHTRQDALYSQHIHRLYGRSARLQNPAAEIADGGRQGCRPRYASISTRTSTR